MSRASLPWSVLWSQSGGKKRKSTLFCLPSPQAIFHPGWGWLFSSQVLPYSSALKSMARSFQQSSQVGLVRVSLKQTNESLRFFKEWGFWVFHLYRSLVAKGGGATFSLVPTGTSPLDATFASIARTTLHVWGQEGFPVRRDYHFSYPFWQIWGLTCLVLRSE